MVWDLLYQVKKESILENSDANAIFYNTLTHSDCYTVVTCLSDFSFVHYLASILRNSSIFCQELYYVEFMVKVALPSSLGCMLKSVLLAVIEAKFVIL